MGRYPEGVIRAPMGWDAGYGSVSVSLIHMHPKNTAMSMAIFRDADLQTQWERDGYVMIPLLEAEAVAALRAVYDKLHPQAPEPGFYSTIFSESAEFKQEVFAAADRWIGPHVERIFRDYKKLGASFLAKQPGKAGEMPIHQDWTSTDESRWRMLTMWIPLEDVDATHGALQVLPGSTRFSNALRAPTLPVIWRDVLHLLTPRMRSMPMQAGHALIFDHSLLHSSHQHKGPEARIALAYGVTMADAELCYYYHDAKEPDAELIERYAVPDDFFMRHYEVSERPKDGKLTGKVRQNLDPVTEKECKALLMAALPAIYRPIQDAALLKTVPKAQGGLLKRLFSKS